MIIVLIFILTLHYLLIELLSTKYYEKSLETSQDKNLNKFIHDLFKLGFRFLTVVLIVIIFVIQYFS